MKFKVYRLRDSEKRFGFGVFRNYGKWFPVWRFGSQNIQGSEGSVRFILFNFRQFLVFSRKQLIFQENRFLVKKGLVRRFDSSIENGSASGVHFSKKN